LELVQAIGGKRVKKKELMWIGIAAVVILAAGGGYMAYARVSAVDAAEQEPQLQTSAAYQGDIVISALGSGNLLPSTEIDLVFDASGLVAEVLVEVGDEVQAGDVLAQLDTTDLERAVTQAEINLRQAEISLEAAVEPPDGAAIRAAQDALDQAAGSLRLEQISYAGTMSSTLIAESLPDAQANYEARLADYNGWLVQFNEGQADSWYVDRALEELNEAELQLARTQQSVDEQIQSANNGLASAVDHYNQAQANLDALLAGADSLDIESLELKVQTSEMDVEVARENLENATLIAPFDGVVTAVGVRVGETVGSTTVAATLADLSAPVMQFWVEEADMGSAVVGNPVSVIFEALPDLTFMGEIVRVEPTLVVMDGTTAVQLWASVDTSMHAVELFAGMNAEVEIIAGEALNVLMVPVQALRELTPGQYAVFVVHANGELELRPVEVGLKDYVNAEIISGLELGEVVSTGEVQTISSVEVPEVQMPGGGIMIPGGGRP
jgi:HlyD family secretion protein